MMQMSRLVWKLGRNDVRLFGRDSFYWYMAAFAIIIALVLRHGLPWMNAYLSANGVLPSDTISASLADYYPMIVTFMALFNGALIVGTIFGFGLLDERDQNTIQAMLVTPVPLDRYVLYRTGGPAVIACIIIFMMLLIIDQALLSVWQMLLLSAAASLTAPIASLFYASFAENKVQGFAYGKFTGIAGWIIMLGWFIPEPFQWLLGLFPPFWVTKAYWMALQGRSLWWAAMIVGVIFQAGLIRYLMLCFNRAVYR